MNEAQVIDLFERSPRTARIYMINHRGSHTYSVASAAIKASGLNLRWVRDEIVDQALCRAALADDYRAILYVPRDLRTPGTMIIAADRYRLDQRKPPPERLQQFDEFSFLPHVIDEVKTDNIDAFVKRWESGIKSVADFFSAEFFRKVHDRDPGQFRIGSKLHAFLQAHGVNDFMFVLHGYILSEEQKGKIAYIDRVVARPSRR